MRPLADFAGCLVLLTSVEYDPLDTLHGFYRADGAAVAELGVFSGDRYGEHCRVVISNRQPIQYLRRVMLRDDDAGPYVGWVMKRDAPGRYPYQIVFEPADDATREAVIRAGTIAEPRA